MKHNLKRILPILLAIVVICSIIWYLFIYDRDFTRDMLVGSARYFEQRGNHTTAAWFYDQAYRYSGESEDVAIELAERFLAIGDYTKAERTLSRAIKNGGSVKLYIALSKTYVEQDKLKDAVAMLDNVTNDDIKAQLDTLRPAAPTTATAPGYYSQYITVAVENTVGTLYLTTDGSYPSAENASSDGSVTLAGGENTIRALAVDDNGLVSPLAVFGYVVQGVIEEVTLSDSSIDALIREQLQVGADATLFTDDLWAITSLTMPADAQNSADLAHLTNLQKLTVKDCSIDGWSSISALTELTELHMQGCLVSAQDLLVIASLPKLEKLTLSGCNLSSIQNLSAAKHLKYLNLSNNTIRDITPLSFMSGLEQLDLNHNALDNLSAISALAGLKTLDVSYNSLVSIAPLSGCTQLTKLNIRNNTIEALTGAESLKNLVKLDAAYNALTNITPVSTCSNLTELDISNNSLTDISTLSNLSGLQYLNFSRNQVTALPGWSKSCALVTIDGSYNGLSTISSLAGYESLNNVLMDYNKISSVNALSACTNLISVSVYGNPVSDVSALTDMSVIVSYTPNT